MNGLNLRISNAGGKKAKNSVNFAPINVFEYFPETLGKKNQHENIQKFINSSTTDEQLNTLKQILVTLVAEEYADNTKLDKEIFTFLAIVFLNSEAKHPVKCFLTRQITKNSALLNPFSDALAEQITSLISNEHQSYKQYIVVVSKLATCIENFPAGSAAIKKEEIILACYLDGCLKCCIGTLTKTKSLSPTEKNEIFNLAHLALRLLLYITQKVSQSNIQNLCAKFSCLRRSIKYLLFDDEVPMDTKSVCGILYLTIHILENGCESWIEILQTHANGEISSILSNEASQLSLYSAIATVVAVDRLQSQIIKEEPALILLNKQLLAIGERSSSESIFILGVTRTLVQISKGLDKVTDNFLGLSLVTDLLGFVWTHLEHYMDSVRHLTAQILTNIVRYCSMLYRRGNPQALDNLFTDLTSLDKASKSYFVSLTTLIMVFGAEEVLRRLPSLIGDVMTALSLQAVQASATTTLETLLQKNMKESDTDTIYKNWIKPILDHVACNTLDSGVLNILENLLATAVKLDDKIMAYVLPHIKKSPTDLKCVLMLLSVARKSGVTNKLALKSGDEEWKGIIGYDVLKMAAVDAVEETRILSLSLVAESPKTTEVFSRGELQFVLYFLKYNANAQAPNFRQLVLAMMKKFIKRLEDSYKVLKQRKESSDDYYSMFLGDLRAFCFGSLIPGANYSRRVVALQILVWCERLHIDGYQRIWKADYVEKLLVHLEDSYENNKALAMEILNKCPVNMIACQKYSISLQIEDILLQASSMKPTDCVSAAHKLELLRNKLPEKVLEGNSCDVSESVMYVLLQRLHDVLCRELTICEQSIISAAINAPMCGILHCMVHLMTRVDVRAISSSEEWSVLISDIIDTCVRVNASVACVVNNSSPEGHLPMDMGEVQVTDHGNSGGVRLEDGRQVTAQMVLLCAWRSVKEVSLLLGEISSRVTIVDEDGPQGNLTVAHMALMGEHFTKLLAETKHRGAFEQAYVGFTKFLTRLWRCRAPALHSRPRAWLTSLTGGGGGGGGGGRHTPTRRSAGLPYMIQALVSTELQVHSNPKCFHECMATLLRLARAPAESKQSEMAIETRTNSINILRALFRNSTLDESVAGYVEEGLIVALEGFGGRTWMERNSSTLLFSALMVRIFGVQRTKDTEDLCVRNRMTGRIFFLRYPHLYDFMLNKLKEVSSSDNTQLLRPSLYPILLLLARLYPSSLEGTVSNLKLVAYVPHVLACAKSRVLKTRQLAAKAMVPLISPEQYVQHLESMFSLICNINIQRNYCHGILLQLIRLVDSKSDTVSLTDEAASKITSYIVQTLWILDQASGNKPCYLLADEYVKLINLLLWRFPSLMKREKELTKIITDLLEKLLWILQEPQIANSGKDVCLANATYLLLIISSIENDVNKLHTTIYRGLTHHSYEVILSTLNFLLILNNDFEIDNRMEAHLAMYANKGVLKMLNEVKKYIQTLCNILKSNNYLECTQKALKVLILVKDAERFIVETKLQDKQTEITNDVIISTLIKCINNEQRKTYIYLKSLSNFIKKNLKDSNTKAMSILEVIRVVFACSSSDNDDGTRYVVVGFVEDNFAELLNFNLDGLNKEEIFEYKATLYATLVTVLEDDHDDIRQRISNIITNLHNIHIATPPSTVTSNATVTSPKVISTKSAEYLRDLINTEENNFVLFFVLALLDFKSEVCMNDEVNDECRVFDQNERYNIYLEETVWTMECADKIIQQYHTHTNLIDVLQNDVFSNTIKKLCKNNLVIFENMIKEDNSIKNNLINPKIRLLVEKLHKYI